MPRSNGVSGRSASVKEPASRKASGLAHLMSALHQNAAAVVTSNSQLNGPDQVLPAEGFVSTRRNGCVKLRREEHGLGSEEPISIPTMFRDISEAYPDTLALRVKRAGQWVDWTYEQYLADVQIVARAFIHLGLHRHHSVAILGRNSPEWTISNVAAIFAGGISVGLPVETSPEDIARAAIDAKADVAVVDNEAMLKKVLLIQHKLPDLRAIVQLRGEPPLADKRRLHRTHKKHILSWEQLNEVGQDLPEVRLDDRVKRIAINHCATLVYSPDVKGASRSVMLSHDNLTWCSKMILGFVRAPGFNRLPSPGEEVLLSFLPPHVSIAAHIIDVYYSMSIAGTLCFYEAQDNNNSTDLLSDSTTFFEALTEVQPTVFFANPPVYERIYHKLRETRRNMSGLQRIFLDWSSSTLREKHLRGRIPSQRAVNASSNGGSAQPGRQNKLSQWQTSIAKNTVAKKQRESLGFGNRTVFMCSSRGDSLTRPVLKFLAGFDIVVHETFGQPEHCGMLTANIPKRYCKMGTLGKPVPGAKSKIEPLPVSDDSDDITSASAASSSSSSTAENGSGKILGYGRNLFMGYLNRQCESKDCLTEDGWLRLGDLGAVDADGFLLAEGRKDEDAVTIKSGEVIMPQKIEQLIRLELPCVRHAVVVGDGEDYLAALLTLQTEPDEFDPEKPGNTLTEEARRWFRHARFDMRTIEDVIDNMEGGLQFAFQAGVDRANQSVPSTSQFIHCWKVLAAQFSYQSGELTIDGRLRRHAINEIHRACVRSLFDANSPCSGNGGVCLQPPDKSNHLLRPPQNLLLQQLSQIKEEDESKASSRNSIDKVDKSAVAPSPSTSIRVVDNTAPSSNAASPAVSARQVILISREDITKVAPREEEEGSGGYEDEDDTLEEETTSGDVTATDDGASSSASSSKNNRHNSISESFSNDSSSAGEMVVKERITRK